eukprot:CAMPEP_0172491864 /NCGR_PEP_ID=MMETSP1066-20121228/22768_1 /TAXON_ID=671091 /ORGANISM="Coscinodiscus wailesii, Strain CCMP2513" /LENGTH=687 /DNA_ID=CAMNT_0013261131 /DNA_START=174 /DNA_END=2233 /DNA_ORIENTATION=-
MVPLATRVIKRLKENGGLRRVASASKSLLALVGVYTVVPVAYDYYLSRKENEGEWKDKEKKSVLVIPFHRMKIVETKKRNLISFLVEEMGVADTKKDSRPIEVESKELVEIIHEAAQDPEIVALYGIFGSGTFSAGGYGHLEEIRNAVRVFNESHRRHHCPRKEKGTTTSVAAASTTGEGASLSLSSSPSKYSFAFGDSLSTDAQYYLASVFSHVGLRARGGGVTLVGPSASAFFLREGLETWGVKVDVFKHGKYKNAPNSLTEDDFTAEHLENTSSYLESIDDYLLSGMSASRHRRKGFVKGNWDIIREYGSMTAANAKEIGLIDCYLNVFPLEEFVEANKDGGSVKNVMKRLNKGIDADANLDSFCANHSVSLNQYRNRLKKRKVEKQKRDDWEWKKHQVFEKLAENGVMKNILAQRGIEAPNFNIDKDEYLKESSRVLKKEKIVIINVGDITDEMGTKVINSLKKVKEDESVKSVILRIDSRGGSAIASEMIHAECQTLSQPIVCSMANYAASGGYYVAANAKRIFALPTTITGSIGVFGIRPDFTELAKRYGINTRHVVLSRNAGMNDPFCPLTAQMKNSLARSVDDVYATFKRVVAEGRSLSLEDVERIAQGRVYTGSQAREVGLVDEWGDLSKAVSYAQRNFTESGAASVEVWPKVPSFGERVREVMGEKDGMGVFGGYGS